MLPFYGHTHFPSPSSPIPGNQSPALHFSNFVHLLKIISMNHRICNILEIFFFFFFHTQHNSLEIIQFAEFIVSSFHFIATWSSKIYMYHRLFNSLLVEGHLGCFSLVTSTNKSTINIYVQVLYEKHFHFSGINVSGMLKISTV